MKLTKEEINGYLEEYCEERIRVASEKLATFSHCRKIYDSMSRDGFTKQMEVFRNIIFLTICLHPDWSEYEVLIDFTNHMEK